VATAWAQVEPQGITAPSLLHMDYEPEHGYSQTLRDNADGTVTLYVKGAPDKLIGFSHHMLTADGTTALDSDHLHAANDQMAERGLRVLATASRVYSSGDEPTGTLPTPEGLTLLGLQGMHDPPREGVADAIAACRKAGIQVMMITGDHPKTAKSIAEDLGIELDQVNVKATTTEKLGFTGREEGIAVHAVALLVKA